MCGIAGFLSANITNACEQVLTRMGDAIKARGPDDSGTWYSVSEGIGLSHRRLSVQDITLAGHQPMSSPSGRYAIVYNGEVYNHIALRNELENAGFSGWTGHSDTETLLAAFDAWGIQATIQRAIGMFAIGVWDRETKTLILARDRLGEKPLYYGWQKNTFLFGSELKALVRHPDFIGEIDRGALALYMRHNYIPSPYSIYRGIAKLKPGCILEVTLAEREPRIRQYWSVHEAMSRGLSNPFTGDITQAVGGLDDILRRAISRQMIADVPLGAFLSGGVDSSTVVALMQSQSSRPVKTFSIGFSEELYNEAQHARAVAQHLGTDHAEWYVSSTDALNVVPKLAHIYDEPFADSSQIPTLLVSQMARRHVTVSLSGDAGDELFCGYNRYVITSQMWHRLSFLPTRIRAKIANILLRISPSKWNQCFSLIQSAMPRSMRHVNIGDKLHKGAEVMTASSITDLYRGLVSHWRHPASVVLGASEPPTILDESGVAPESTGDIERMMALDMVSYLPDDILCKVDRAAMYHSLETRVPFLDHSVVEFALRLPLDYKLRGGVGKWVLREVLYKYVPRSLIERPKMGFGVPIDVWLRGPLRDWAEALLDENRLRQEGFFDPLPIRKKWSEHLTGQRNWQYHLWDVLMFQEWINEKNKAV